MKKFFIVLLAVAFVIGVMFAGSAQAGVGDTFHDLSNASWTYSGASDDLAPYSPVDNDFTQVGTTQMCVFCHHPHRSVGATLDTRAYTNEVLWNQVNQSSAYAVYNSDSIDGAVGNVTSTSGMRTYLCLACHDGDIAANALVALPGDIGAGQTVLKTLDGGQLIQPGESQLQDDHPVNVVYDETLDTGLGANVGDEIDNIYPLFGGKVQCATCHDVHDSLDTSSTGVQFMRVSAWGPQSAICISCHTNK